MEDDGLANIISNNTKRLDITDAQFNQLLIINKISLITFSIGLLSKEMLKMAEEIDKKEKS